MKPITQARFDALCYSRTPAASYIFEEVEWFADEKERVLGIVAQHFEDQDWAWAVLGRDANGLFRAVDGRANIASKDEARNQLQTRLLYHASTATHVFVQGDERKHTIRLFDTLVPPKHENAIFKLIKNGIHHSAARAIMQEIANAFVDVDGNYVKDFQTSGFNARLWELYLFAFFHEQRFSISRDFNRPDFLLEKGVRIAVEAVTVNSTDGKTAPSPTSEEELKLLRAEYMPIKFGSALFSKLNKRYWELPHVSGTPFLLAIHDFQSNNSMTWSAPSLSDYLYGLRATWHHGEHGKLHITENRIQEHTWGKKVIPSGFFDLAGAENISAVLFSNSGTISKFNRMGKLAGFGDSRVVMIQKGILHDHNPNSAEGVPFQLLVEPGRYSETWSEGVRVFHNPGARMAVPIELFPRCAHYFLRNGKRVGFLPQRFVHESVTHIVCPKET